MARFTHCPIRALTGFKMKLMKADQLDLIAVYSTWRGLEHSVNSTHILQYTVHIHVCHHLTRIVKTGSCCMDAICCFFFLEEVICIVGEENLHLIRKSCSSSPCSLQGSVEVVKK
jgi:phage-related holin